MHCLRENGALLAILMATKIVVCVLSVCHFGGSAIRNTRFLNGDCHRIHIVHEKAVARKHQEIQGGDNRSTCKHLYKHLCS